MTVFEFYRVLAFCLNYVRMNDTVALDNEGLGDLAEKAEEMLPKVFQQYFIPEKMKGDEILATVYELLGVASTVVSGLALVEGDTEGDLIQSLALACGKALNALEKQKQV